MKAEVLDLARAYLNRCADIAAEYEAHGHAPDGLLADLIRGRTSFERVYDALVEEAQSDSEAAAMLWQIPSLLSSWGIAVLSADTLVAWNDRGRIAAKKIVNDAERFEAQIRLCHNLAFYHARRGYLELAERNLKLAIWFVHELKQTAREGQLLGDLAELMREKGDNTAAKEFLRKSLDFAQLAGDSRGEIKALFRMGQFLRASGEIREAQTHLRRALERSRELQLADLELRIVLEFAAVMRYCSDVGAARNLYTEARGRAKDRGDRMVEVRATESLGDLCFEEDRLDEARELYLGAFRLNSDFRKAARSPVPIFVGHFDELTAGRLFQSLGAVAAKQDKVKDAVEYLREAVRILGRAGDRAGDCQALYNLALAKSELGDIADALDTASQAEQIAEGIGSPLLGSIRRLLRALKDKQSPGA
jgi:tetratricopeptide (TPR) repeat protein